MNPAKLLAMMGEAPRGSVIFYETADYLQVPANVAFNFGAGDFDIEFFWRPATLSTVQMLVSHTNDVSVSGAGEYVVLFNPNTAFGLRFFGNGGLINVAQGATTGWSVDTWHHVAVVRDGTDITLYRNGIAIASGSSADAVGTSTLVTQIGGDNINPSSMSGHLSNVRMVKGEPVYTSDFTPPRAPLLPIAGTSLLTAQSPVSIKDASSQQFAITVVGDAAPSALNPF